MVDVVEPSMQRHHLVEDVPVINGGGGGGFESESQLVRFCFDLISVRFVILYTQIEKYLLENNNVKDRF